MKYQKNFYQIKSNDEIFIKIKNENESISGVPPRKLLEAI